jgi:hypothetical protein
MLVRQTKSQMRISAYLLGLVGLVSQRIVTKLNCIQAN